MQDIFILGATGKVGKTLVNQIIDSGDSDESKHKNPTQIVGLASSSDYLYSEKGISVNNCRKFINKEIIENKLSKQHFNETFDKIKNDDSLKTIFVDVTASKDMLGFHKEVMNYSHLGIVTANKLPLVDSSFEDFNFLTKDVSREYGMLSLPSSMHKGQYPGHTYLILDKDGMVRFVRDDPQMAVRNDELKAELAKIN